MVSLEELMHRRFILVLRLCLLLILVAGATLPPQSSAHALTTLTVEPLTWNVIGLDSNDVSVGPNHFPIGARICNEGGQQATNVTATFVWDDGGNLYSGDPYINLRPGTLSTINLGTLDSGACATNYLDAYFEVAVTRNAGAYDHTREYHIDVTAGNVSGTISTPRPRELYVEHLISQSRNTVSDIRYGTSIGTLASVTNGGTMNLMVGNTYYIQLVGSTATQGYEQIETFINFPNTVFQVLSVNTTYSAETSAALTPPYDQLYGDACVWENDPNSPNYRACLSTGKAGGNISVTYQVKILQVPGAPLVNPQPLSTLIYDFSGSSFHYNADYGISTRYANIINASISKSFSPKTITPGGTSTLTFTINNPGGAAMSSVSFTDDLPTGMTLANSSVASSGCGGALPATVSDPMSFSNITVAGLSTCTVAVTVTAASNGTYNNTSGNLFIGTTNTGSTASDTLVVSSQPTPPAACTTPSTLATWNFNGLTTGANSGPFAGTLVAGDVSGALAKYGAGTGSSSGITNSTSNTFPGDPNGFVNPVTQTPDSNSWGIHNGWPAAGVPTGATTPYFQFQINAFNYGGVSISAAANLQGNWTNGDFWYVFTSPDETTWTQRGTGAWANNSYKTAWGTVSNNTSKPSNTATTYFRVYFVGAGSKTDETVFLDNVTITGCPNPPAPTISKSFGTDPLAVGASSQLTFTITNNGTNATDLTGVSFTDVLPGGLELLSPAVSNTCGGTLTLDTTTDSIALSGGTLNASNSCTIVVNVQGGVSGTYTNTTTNITSAQTGPNTSTTANVGFGQDTITVVAPPVLAKSFSANPIFTGNNTSLDFDITNPNASTALTGVAFTDVLPAGLLVANGTFSVCGGTNNLTTTAATRTIALLNSTTIAAGGTCSFTVTVTGSTTGSYTNTTGNISSTNGGTGNTAIANVLVKTPAPAIKLLKQVASTVNGPWVSFLSIGTNTPVYYQFTVENVGDVDLTSVNVTDPLGGSAISCSWVDGDGGALTAPFTLTKPAAGHNKHIASCTISTTTNGTAGSYPNTAKATDSVTTVTDESTATYANPALTLVKTASPTTFTSAGDTINYSYLVTNSGDASLLGPVTVSDNKTSVVCPAVNTVGDNDAWFDVDESLTCTASYTVLANDVTAGSVTNIASATVSGITSNEDSETVYAPFDLAITKTNGVATVNAGGTTTYTVRATNNGPATITGAILSDPAVIGLSKTVVACSATAGQCATAPTIPELEGGAFALPSLASGQFYEITVTATVTATIGNVTNTATIAAPAGGTDTNPLNNSASDIDTVTPVADLVISKNDGVTSLNAGGTTTYTIRVTNNGPSSVANAVLSDPAVTGLTKTGVACSATPGQCSTAPTIDELEGGSFTLPDLGSGQFYEITVSATVSASSGNVTNSATVTPPAGTTNPGTSCVTSGGITRTFNAGTGVCTSTDSNSVTSVIDLSLDKQASNSTPAVSSTLTFTLVVANAGPGTATNIVVTDIIPNGYSYVASSIAGGASRDDSDPAGTGLTWTISSLASGASTNLTYQVTVLGTGAYNNYAEITSHTETDSNSTPGNSSTTEDDDDTEVVTPAAIQPPSIVKQFSPSTVTTNAVSSLTFTITNPNAGVALTGVAFTDSFPAGMQVAATPGATTSGCGSPTFAPASGNTSLSFSGGTVAASGTCTVSVNVVSTTVGTKTNTTGNITSTNGGTGNTATAKLGVVYPVKSVVSTSEDSTTGTSVAIGEVVRYQLVLEMPEGTTANLQILDNIVGNLAYLNDGTTRVAFVCNSGAACASSSVAAIGSSPVISGNAATTPTFGLPAAAIANNDGGATGNPFPDGHDPMFSLGTVTNNDNDADAEYVVIEFNALVRNLLANQDGNSRGNTFTVSVNGSVLATSANVQITIREPAITGITKTVTATPTDAGDAITYQLQFQNTGLAPAFDITITDTLNAALTTPVTVSGSTTGGNCGSTASTVSGSYSAPTVTATVTCLAAGGTATVNITANVSNTASAGYTFSNAANLTYTSLPGTNGTASNPTGSTTPGAPGTGNGERNGSGGTDDYTALSNTVSTTLASPSIAKTINPAGTSYAIGTSIPYQITVTIPEGMTGGPLANIVETIPSGLVYVPGSLSVTAQPGVTIGAAGPYTDANASFFNLTGQTMTLSFGSLTSTASASATNRTVTIAFNARVDNIVANQSGATFNNSVDFVRTNPNGPGTLALNATNASASVVEPDLTVAKTASTSTPALNSTVTYTLTIQHTGSSNSAAYLWSIRDTLPGGLTGLNNVDISSTAPDDCATGVSDTSTDSALNVTINTVPLGCAVTITYDATVSGAVGSTQTNSVAVAWASTPNGSGGDRTGADGPSGALNNYAVTGSTPVTVNPIIDAVNDNFSSSPIDGGSGGTTVSVIDNDTTNGVAAVIGTNVTLTPGTAPTPATGSITMNPDGTISVAAGTTEGTYTYPYTICTDPATTPATCDNATATITINLANDVPVANDDIAADIAEDSGLTNIPILGNDTFGGDGPSSGTITITSGPGAAGTATVNNGGTLNDPTDDTIDFTPAANYNGPVSISYQICDSNNDCDPANVTFDVTPANDVPAATDNEGSVDVTTPTHANNMVTGDEGHGVDSDPDSDTLTVTQLGTETDSINDVTGTYGTLDWDDNGNYSYTLNTSDPDYLALAAGATATDTFPYTISDGKGGTATANVIITITGANDAPTATDNEGGVDATTPTHTNNMVTGNEGHGIDSDTDGDILTVILLGTEVDPLTDVTGTYGILDWDSNGNYTYTLNTSDPDYLALAAGATAADSFPYTISDGNGGTATANIIITITGANDAPIATDNEGSVDSAVPTHANNMVIGNEGHAVDSDPDGDPLTVSDIDGITDPAANLIGIYGTLDWDSNGNYTYTLNTSDPDYLALATGATATDIFSYTISDGSGGTATANIIITITGGANIAPSATDNEGSVDAATPTHTNNMVTGNEGNGADSDPNSDPLTVSEIDGVTDPTVDVAGTYGSLNWAADGSYTYTLNMSDPDYLALAAGATATDTFSYTISDGKGGTATANVIITITGGNDAPTATDNEGSVDVTSPIHTNNMVTGNEGNGVDSDPDGDTLTVTQLGLETNPANDVSGTYGSINWAADGSYTYTLNTSDPDYLALADGATVTDTFPYTINDGKGGTATANVIITITKLVGPDAVDDTDTTAPGTSVTTDVLDNDDLGTTPTSITSFTQPANGSVTCSATDCTYTPNSGFSGVDTYTYTITDDNGLMDTATVRVTVGNIFDPPFGLKTFNAAGLPVLRWTMVWINNSNTTAINVQVIDPISAGTSFAGNLVCTVTGVSTTALCQYDAGTNQVIWRGNLGPDDGATNAGNANNEVLIAFDVNIASGTTSVQNVATSDYDGNGDGDLLDAPEQDVSTVSSTWLATQPPAPSTTSSLLPSTGFAPRVVTDLSNVPPQAYTATGDVTIEIPSLGVKLPVVGVPKKDGTWNVSWLTNQAGWLEGTAFPSWKGNSVLTSHVYLSNGLPGPFVNLGKLKYGDKIVIHAYGEKYTFEVRENKIVEPNDTSVMKHEEKSWLTLITCKEYDPATNTYRKRIAVRAVLVSVASE